MSSEPIPFQPIHTERLVIRCPVASDAEAAYERRGLPEVARFQDWTMPYTRERAERSTALCAEMGGPAVGRTWNATVVDAEDPDRILGDLALELRWEGRVGYFGYTFHPDHWGRGYATEASEALVRYLFLDLGVTRIESSLDPRNPPSARVLEACGLTFEGLTKESFWVGEERSSDMLYGMTRADWDAWRERPRHRPERVELVAVTPANAVAVGNLATHKSQEWFVPTMRENFRDALVPPVVDGAPVVPWYRAIEADGEIVGFVMTAEVGPAGSAEAGAVAERAAEAERTEVRAHGREPARAHEWEHPGAREWERPGAGAHPWEHVKRAPLRARVLRILIDRLHQRRGIGTEAMDQIEGRLRDAGAAAVDVTYAQGPGSPARFFTDRGYEVAGQAETGMVSATKGL